VVAAVELVCAAVAVVWLSAVAEGSAVVVGLGVAVAAVLVTSAVRRWRRADRPATPSAPSGPRRPPPLSADGERELGRIVGVLADAGVFAPRAPDPADLRGPVADHGEPVTAAAVLAALHEADYYTPGFDASAYSADLAFHDSHVEQFADVLRDQVDDLVRLSGGALADVAAAVELGERAGSARVPTRIRLTVDGAGTVLAYDGAGKYLSTVVHVALAGILRARATDRRLAWLWSDQGVWLTALPDGAVDELNTALHAGESWEWVDEQEPTAAGEMYPA